MKRLLWVLLAVVVGVVVVVVVVLLQGRGGETGNETGNIRVATDATWAPFEYIDTNTTEIIGFDIDLFDAIAERADLDVEYVNVPWDPLLAGMATGAYDAAISSISIRPDRLQNMDFSHPYFTAGQIITTLKSNTDITGARVAGRPDDPPELPDRPAPGAAHPRLRGSDHEPGRARGPPRGRAGARAHGARAGPRPGRPGGGGPRPGPGRRPPGRPERPGCGSRPIL